jgi:hypothetical protein
MGGRNSGVQETEFRISDCGLRIWGNSELQTPNTEPRTPNFQKSELPKRRHAHTPIHPPNSKPRTSNPSAHLDQQLAGCLSSFQIVIGLCDICHGVDALDSEFERSVRDPIQDLACALFKA